MSRRDLIANISVDLIPQSGASEEGSLNNRVFSIERVRYILQHFVSGSMTDIFLAVEFTTPEAFEIFRQNFGTSNDPADRLAECKKNFGCLLRILKDPSGNLYPYGERTADYQILQRSLQIPSVNKAALLHHGYIDASADYIYAGLKLHAVTGNHSSAAAQLWKLGVEPNAKLNPTLSKSITKSSITEADLEDRAGLSRTAQIFLWRSYDVDDAEQVNTGTLLATVAAADNTKTASFKPGVQTYYSMLLAMRSMIPRIRAYIISQLR